MNVQVSGEVVAGQWVGAMLNGKAVRIMVQEAGPEPVKVSARKRTSRKAKDGVAVAQTWTEAVLSQSVKGGTVSRRRNPANVAEARKEHAEADRAVVKRAKARQVTGDAMLTQGLAMVRRTKAGGIHKQDQKLLALCEARNVAEVSKIVKRRLASRAAKVAKAS